MEISDGLKIDLEEFAKFLVRLPKMTSQDDIEFDMRVFQHRLGLEARDDEYSTVQVLKSLVEIHGQKAILGLGIPSENVFISLGSMSDEFAF